ncbi:MAG: ATP-binding protein, partial [Shewanella sp.]|uniref:ATP-binding protein n=1 Tax=Shewanella sp. TaxID=50422 RepID=UPI002649CD5C
SCSNMAMLWLIYEGILQDTGTTSESVYIHITDSGCGLSDNALERLFFPFETSKPQGLGLGMVICKRIIEEHKGKIEAQHAAPGLTVKVTLPLNLPSA